MARQDPMALTNTQRHHLELIKKLKKESGRFPTFMEMARAGGYRSPCACQLAVEQLIRKGYIEEDGKPRQARRYRIVERDLIVETEGIDRQITTELIDHMGDLLAVGSTRFMQGSKILGCWTPAEMLEGRT
jgi:SOS-response transcriptional repressor LexA